MSTELSDTALILIDHGSRRDEANRAVERIAERTRARGVFAHVGAAHMELAEPNLIHAFEEAARAGVRRIIVVPYFLAMGSHVTSDIPRLCSEAGAAHPEISWSLAGPLGVDERLVDIVVDRAIGAIPSTLPPGPP